MKAVTISVRTLQRDKEGREDQLELTTKGTYEKRNGVQILRYDETELTGMSGTTTTIELHSNRLALIRTGKVTQHQEFHPGESYRSRYVTPFGTLSLSMHTHLLEHTLNEGTGRITLRYDVALEGVQANYNELTIDSREDNGN